MDTVDSLGRNQQVTFVTESGLYDVIIRSDSDKAKPFRKWVTSEVLPSIRKHGAYMVTTEEDTPETIMEKNSGLKFQLVEGNLVSETSFSQPNFRPVFIIRWLSST